MATNKNRSFFDKIFHKENLFFTKLLIITALFILSSSVIFLQNYKGDVKLKLNDVLNRDIIAFDDIRYVDEDASKRNEEIIRMTTPGYFKFDLSWSSRRIEFLNNVIELIEDGVEYSDIRGVLEEHDISLTLNEFKVIHTMVKEGRIEVLLRLISDLYRRGVVDISLEKTALYDLSGVIIMTDSDSQINENFYSSDEFQMLSLTANDIKLFINSYFLNYTDLDKKLIENFLIRFMQPNIFPDTEKTNFAVNSRLENERNVYRKMLKGQVVARKGDIVDKDNINKIAAVLNNKKDTLNIRTVLGFSIINMLLIIFTYFFIKVYEASFFSDIKNLLFIASVYLLFIIYLSLPINFDNTSYFLGILIPISTISITFIFLYSKIISVLMTIVFSIAFYIFSGYNSSSFLFVIFSGICSIFTIKPLVKKRVEVLIAGFYVAVINIVIGFALAFYDGLDMLEVLNYTFYAGINGVVSGVFSLGLIAVGEFTLNTLTVFRLQELTDTSSPLLKKLFDTAIGTYTHSINVANLAEAAANEINANGLLARVGGLYHDIGKSRNAEYFIENQGENNIHNDINPFISVNIIRAHVKLGVEEAAAYKLPKKVIDIIYQHHGRSLIKFFYNSAVNNKKDDTEILKEDFMYKSDNPSFPESAVVMLSDQIEAIARVLNDYSEESITKMVNSILDDKFKEGILDSSGLTFNDITNIKKVFIRTLTGMYHSRIEYPDINKKELSEESNGDKKYV